jgi:hypothetical protein
VFLAFLSYYLPLIKIILVMGSVTESEPLRASSVGGGRFNNNDVHDHLLRMERQFAEIEAQHQQVR